MPPRLVSRAEWSILALAGTEVTLPCEVTGDPWPSVRWSRDQLGIDFYSDDHKYMMQDTGSLIIPRVDVDDAARYLCVAENPAGVVSQEIILVVHGTPVSPSFALLCYRFVVVRPPNIVVGGLKFYRDSSIFFFFFFFSLIRTQPKRATYSEVSAIFYIFIICTFCSENVCQNEGIPPPRIRRPQNHLFQRFRNFVANLTACFFGTKHDIRNSASALEVASSTMSRNTRNFRPRTA